MNNDNEIFDAMPIDNNIGSEITMNIKMNSLASIAITAVSAFTFFTILAVKILK